MKRNEILEGLQSGKPFEGMANIRVVKAKLGSEGELARESAARPDVIMVIDFAGTTVTIYGELKSQVTPRIVRELAPWLARVKELNPSKIYALICPYLSPTNQMYCLNNGIDFIDLSGNVSIQIPGKIWIQRLNCPNLYRTSQLVRNPFSGSSSRVIRVLLQNPNAIWSNSRIEEELSNESKRWRRPNLFAISQSTISKTIQSLEEEVLVRRDGRKIVTPDPRQLLFRWAEKYREIWKREKRKSWISKNPIGFDIEESCRGLKNEFEGFEPLYTGSAAANLVAPFVNIDRFDIFIIDPSVSEMLRGWSVDQGVGPDFQFVEPYDQGVLMYARQKKGVTIASDIQIYLDCYARGGRDAKQAEYLFTKVIETRWQSQR